ncbi:MAG: M1 family aminopeptidase [Salibacteraceae bacterium]
MRYFTLLILFVFSWFLSVQAQENYIDPEYKFHSFSPHETVETNKTTSRSAHADDYDIHHLTLSIEANPPQIDMIGFCELTFTVNKPIDTLTFDFTDESTFLVNYVHINGVNYPNFTRFDDKIKIPLSTPLAVGSSITSTVSYQGYPQSGANGYYYSRVFLGSRAFWTMSEPYGAKYWWPCKIDLIDKIDSTDIYLTYPDGMRGSTVGVLQSEQSNGTKTTAHWKHNYPINNYLIAVAIGDYWVKDTTLNYSGKQLYMTDYLYQHDSLWHNQSMQYLEKTFSLFDSLFGEYPFSKEKYGHTQFTRGGGMEHQTNSWMQDLNQPLVAHELAHQWFGNKVTCGSWQDLWLNEGFATYLTALTYEAGFGDMDWTTWKQNTFTLVGGSYGSVWRQDTLNFSSLFSSRYTYNKGALALHALRWICGDDAFFSGVRNYLNDPLLEYSFARTTDLQRHLEATSNLDLTEQFADWVYGQNCPRYSLAWRISGGSIVFNLDQIMSNPVDSFFEMTVPIGVYEGGKRHDYLFPFDNNNMSMVRPIKFMPDSVVIDPDLWICSTLKNVTEGIHKNVTVGEYENGQQSIIYPNPAKNEISIVWLNALGSNTEVLIYDIMGKKMGESIVSKGELNTQIDLSNYPRGTYQIVTKNEREIRTNKIILQ